MAAEGLVTSDLVLEGVGKGRQPNHLIAFVFASGDGGTSLGFGYICCTDVSGVGENEWSRRQPKSLLDLGCHVRYYCQNQLRALELILQPARNWICRQVYSMRYEDRYQRSRGDWPHMQLSPQAAFPWCSGRIGEGWWAPMCSPSSRVSTPQDSCLSIQTAGYAELLVPQLLTCASRSHTKIIQLYVAL